MKPGDGGEHGRRPADPGFGGLCPGCAHVRFVRSGKGSTFLLCRKAETDPRYPKYPPQPVRSCPAHEKVASPP